MEKQRTVNTVTANDEFSSGLMEAYGRWMGGDTFQNSTIKEEEIPTGQKQGGGDGAAFKTAIGELPAIEFDKSAGLPTIPELGVKDETGKKDPKAASTGGEPPTNPQGLKPKYGAQIRNTVLVGANEEVSDADKYSGVVCKKCGGNHLTENCPATNEEIEAYLRSESERILTELSELTKTTYTVQAEAWDVKEEPVNIHDTEEWKTQAKKQTDRIMDMWKEGYGKKKKEKGCS